MCYNFLVFQNKKLLVKANYYSFFYKKAVIISLLLLAFTKTLWMNGCMHMLHRCMTSTAWLLHMHINFAEDISTHNANAYYMSNVLKCTVFVVTWRHECRFNGQQRTITPGSCPLLVCVATLHSPHTHHHHHSKQRLISEAGKKSERGVEAGWGEEKRQGWQAMIDVRPSREAWHSSLSLPPFATKSPVCVYVDGWRFSSVCVCVPN